MRGRYVRKVLYRSYRGKAFMERALCVNECDFYTMDPLDTIPFPQFFSYTDQEQFTYGFDIHSLVLLHRKRGEMVNPYNHTKLTFPFCSRALPTYPLLCMDKGWVIRRIRTYLPLFVWRTCCTTVPTPYMCGAQYTSITKKDLCRRCSWIL